MNHLDAQRIAIKAAQKYRAHLAVVAYHTRQQNNSEADIERVYSSLTDDAKEVVKAIMAGKPVAILEE